MLKFAMRAILAISSLVFLIIFGVRSCASYEYPRPSEAFYVNDYADMFGPTLENFLIGESEALYETYKDEPDVGGVQIVFATFALETESQLGAYNKTKLFNEWQIGKNDMGVLVALFFVPLEPAENGNFSLTDVQVETGDQFAEYLATIGLNAIIDATIDYHLPEEQATYSYDYDLGMGVASFMNELLNVAYGDIYGNAEYVVPQDEFEPWYEEYFDNYSGGTSINTTSPMSIFSYFFSSFGNVYDKFLFGTFLVAFTLMTGTAIKGGGGSSSGAGIFRHRR
jgi:uncharacterized protein